MKIKYREFIEDNFLIKDKAGAVVPFVFNETQAFYYDLLLTDYPTLQGIRENILKFRQPGFSSLIDAIFATDFILSALKKIPIITGQIISHKDEETRILFRRVDFFLSSFLEKNKIARKDLLKNDTDHYLEAHSGAELYIGTAGAKTLGRGGTLQNLHWSEVAFYPNTAVLNASEIVPPAEQQVADGIGKIFRETTGNRMFDFFHTEYERGKEPGRLFKSRFLGWWLHKQYTLPAPDGWQAPPEYAWLLAQGVSLDQCYWHFRKIEDAQDKARARREYPTSDIEAFLAAGEQYFDARILHEYQTTTVRDPLPEPLAQIA